MKLFRGCDDDLSLRLLYFLVNKCLGHTVRGRTGRVHAIGAERIFSPLSPPQGHHGFVQLASNSIPGVQYHIDQLPEC